MRTKNTHSREGWAPTTKSTKKNEDFVWRYIGNCKKFFLRNLCIIILSIEEQLNHVTDPLFFFFLFVCCHFILLLLFLFIKFTPMISSFVFSYHLFKIYGGLDHWWSEANFLVYSFGDWEMIVYKARVHCTNIWFYHIFNVYFTSVMCIRVSVIIISGYYYKS